MNEFIDVAVPVGVRKTFAYSVPPEFRERITAGMRVLVPVRPQTCDRICGGDSGQRRRSATLNCARFANCSIRKRLRTPSLVETALWVARYYFAPPGEVLRALFPHGTQVAGERTVALSPRAASLLSGGFRPHGLRPQEDALLDILAQRKIPDTQGTGGAFRNAGRPNMDRFACGGSMGPGGNVAGCASH